VLFLEENATTLGNGRPLMFRLVIQPPESTSCAVDEAEESEMTAGTTTHVDDDRVGGRPHISFSDYLTTPTADDVDGQPDLELLEVPPPPPSPTASLRPPPLPPPASPRATTSMRRIGRDLLRPPQVS